MALWFGIGAIVRIDFLELPAGAGDDDSSDLRCTSRRAFGFLGPLLVGSGQEAGGKVVNVCPKTSDFAFWFDHVVSVFPCRQRSVVAVREAGSIRNSYLRPEGGLPQRRTDKLPTPRAVLSAEQSPLMVLQLHPPGFFRISSSLLEAVPLRGPRRLFGEGPPL